MRIHRMAAMCACAAALLLGGFDIARSQTTAVTVAPERVVSRDEFYFYDENKLRRPLTLSRSVAVRFQTQKSADDKTKLLKDQGSLTVREIAQLYSRAEYALDYIPTQNQDARTANIKKLTAVADLEVAPIFTVDGRDAVVDGIYIQTTTPVSRETVLKALEKIFGNAVILEITPQAGVWHVSFKKLFFLDGERFPLTALSVANLLQTSDLTWIKRVYPRFAFLGDTVIPSISVFPISGTVGEERTVVMGFRIFGKSSSDVVIDEADIPEFMQGSFVPQFGGKPPQSSFIAIVGAKVVEKLRRVGPNEWYFEHRYTFDLNAPEADWVFSAFKIPYTHLGVRKEMNMLATTFFVRAHLDSKVVIQDIPSAFTLPVSKFPGFTEMVPTHVAAWFDPVASWVGGRSNVALASKITLGSSALCAIGFFGFLAVRGFSWTRTGSSKPGIDRRVLSQLLQSAGELKDNHASAQAYHAALSQVLHAWDPWFSRSNVTYQDVKERLGAIRSGEFLRHLENSVGIEELFEDLESRNEASFAARDESELKELGTSLRLKIGKLASELSELQHS